MTGGNSGIGAAMARALGLAGARVLLVARREAELEATARSLRDEGIDASALSADLADAAATRAAARAAEERLGGIDILVNAAGVNLRQPFAEVTPEAWQTQLALHLGAPFFLTQALAPGMAARGWGRIVNIASLQSYRAFPNSAPYGAGKGGVVQLTRAIAQEWGRRRASPATRSARASSRPRLTAPVFADTALADNARRADLHRPQRRARRPLRRHRLPRQRRLPPTSPARP